MDGSAEVSCADFTEIIASFKKRGICFDLILIDPPYNSGFYTEALELISKSNAVSEYCTILCEHSAADVLPEQIGIFSLVKTRKYGTVNISIYRNEVD